MQQLIAAKANLANTLRHTLRHGDVALIVVDYVLRLTAPDGSPVGVTGTATNVIQRQSAGRSLRHKNRSADMHRSVTRRRLHERLKGLP